MYTKMLWFQKHLLDDTWVLHQLNYVVAYLNKVNVQGNKF